MKIPVILRNTRSRRLIEFVLFNALLTVVLVIVAFVMGWRSVAQRHPALSPWHVDGPESEFVASDAEIGYTFADYLAQEDRIFSELDVLIRDEWSNLIEGAYSRFRVDSVCNPETIVDRNWNRSHLLKAEHPVGAALLIHGLSDSPYSLRSLGLALHARGWTVVWLRVPGHGTCPAALADASWKDWTAAVRLAAEGAQALVADGLPLLLVGYSNGGALSVNYAASAVDDPSLPKPDALVLLSPMIGITSMARFSAAYGIVATLTGTEKVAWQNIDPEIDPFKYSSWPMNASVQAWRVTGHVEQQLARLEKEGRMQDFPPVLAFQSAVDSTVVIPQLITRLFDRLPDWRSELVLFDVNRSTRIRDLIGSSYRHDIIPLLAETGKSFTLSVITNADESAGGIHERRRQGNEVSQHALDLEWPANVFSLSHVAIPIPMDDPVLGTREATISTGLPLGSLDLRGESGTLLVPGSLMTRLRHNPFYAFVESRTMTWLDQTLRRDPAVAGARGAEGSDQ